MALTSARVLRQVKADLIGLIPPSMVHAALSRSPEKFRCRKPPPAKLLAAMLVQATHGNTAIEHLKHKTTVMSGVSPQAFCKARQRLPLEILQTLVT